MSRIRYRSVKSAASGKSGPRLALVGCGAIAERYYLPALARYPSVMRSLVLVDRNEERARELAGRFGVKNCIGDYREILNEVDGAIVAVPTHLHFPIGVDFLGRGVHLLCEKPLAETSSRAREMVEQAAKAGATLAANYQCRLYRNLQKVRELLVNGTLGEPLSIEYHVGVKFDWPSVSGFYFNGDLSSRGVLRDQGAHVLDVICWWLGRKPELVSSHNDSFGGSEAVAHVRFKQGRCVGEVKLSWLGKSGSRFVVRCEAGKVEGDIYDYGGVTVTTASGSARRLRLRSGPASYFEIACAMVSNFLRVIVGNEPPLVRGSDVLASIGLIDECYRGAVRFQLPWYEVAEERSG